MYKLYVKTHNLTGLKYLGYTKSKDVQLYKGSGIYWNHHIKKYGYDVITDVIYESDSKKEIKEKGIYYSKLWNIVDSKQWANLKEETGDGGFLLSEESIKKRIETRKIKGNLNTNTKESITKSLKTKRKNGTINVQTRETVLKTLKTKRKNGTLNVNTPESIAKGLETKKENGTLGKNNITKESIEKANETKRKNGTNKRTPESIEKQKKTIAKRGKIIYSQEAIEKMKKPKTKTDCPFCGKYGAINQLKRWHFDNCKLRIENEL